MKKFNYRHSLIVYILSAFIMLTTAVGCFFGVKSAILAPSVFEIIAYSLLSAIGLLLFIISFGIIVYSKYYFKNKKLHIRLGLLCEKIDVSDILTLVHVIDQKKLILSFAEDKYIYAIIKPEEIEAFVKEVKTQNPEVIYEVVYSPIEKEKND